MTISTDWLAKRARLSPRKLALIDTLENRRIDYRQWNENANRTARFLVQRLGLAKGERIAVLATNSVEYLDLLFACNKTGIILQNLNWRLAVPELEELIEHAQPKALFYSADMQETVTRLKLRRHETGVRAYVAMGEKAEGGDPALAERQSLSAEPLPDPELQLSDPWLICYTGGSTGMPKGVILTHGTVEWNAINTSMSWGLDGTDTAVLDASLSHTGGLNVFTTPLVQVGGTLVVCRSFDADQFFDLIASGEISVYFGVPSMFILLQNHPRWASADFSSLKFVISGGAPCPQPVFERFWEKQVDFKTGYGLTEAGPNNFWLPSGQLREKVGSVGYPMFHVEVKLVQPTGAEVSEPGLPGELWIRGPHRTPGYWNNPMATGIAIDDEGWLHTGDLAVVDEDGAYTIVGRAKDMFISGGENVYPAEVESVIYGHDAVREAVVFEVRDPTWGEVGRAVVSLKQGEQLSEQELLDYLSRRLARYKVPRSVVFDDDLPKTGAGKLDRRALRERHGSLPQ